MPVTKKTKQKLINDAFKDVKSFMDPFGRRVLKNNAVIDHIWPKSDNGSNNKQNLMVITKKSNTEKKDLTSGTINDVKFHVKLIGKDKTNNKNIGELITPGKAKSKTKKTVAKKPVAKKTVAKKQPVKKVAPKKVVAKSTGKNNNKLSTKLFPEFNAYKVFIEQGKYEEILIVTPYDNKSIIVTYKVK